MKPRRLILGAALIGAAALAAFGDRNPSDDVAEAVVRPAPARLPTPAPARADASATTAPATKVQRILALAPRESLIGADDAAFGQAANGAGAQGDPFGRHDWMPPPPPPAPAAPPAPPSAPPLPFTFIGKAVADGVWEVYLARGDRTYVVRDKDTIDGAYRVDAIAPPVLTLTYLPLKQVQQLNIGVFD